MKKYIQKDQQRRAEEAGIRFYTSPEEQERARLVEAINRTPSEKFFYLMNLMKMQRLMDSRKANASK